MALAEGLAAKVGGGVVFLGVGGVGIWLGTDYFKNNLSVYDQALISFLQDNKGNDIIFEVKKGTDANTDLTENDLAFSDSNSLPLTAKVKVTADTSSDKFKNAGTGGASDLTKIKALGKSDSGWTWECTLTFKAKDDANKSKAMDTQFKERIYKNQNLGLFGLLKKDISNYPEGEDGNKWNREEIRQVKIGFIRSCGQFRGSGKNKEISGKKAEDAEIKVTGPTFEFVPSGEGSNLKPEDENLFNHWFISKNKDHQTTSA